MNLYISPGHKTSKNWSKPRKLYAFLFKLKMVIPLDGGLKNKIVS